MTTAYAPGARIDHYEIIRLLGQGGMNRVYLARDIQNQQDVVLKFPNDDLIGNVGVFERYKREAEIGSRLNHPYIQHLLNVGEERQEHYLVIEYVQGRTLRQVLEEHAPGGLPQAEALRITLQICDALEYCHEHGVFHRDIKPENIMILDDNNVKIIDFGVALLEGARRVTWRGHSTLRFRPPLQRWLCALFAVMQARDMLLLGRWRMICATWTRWCLFLIILIGLRGAGVTGRRCTWR